jgi:ferredoxin-NADP reductase
MIRHALAKGWPQRHLLILQDRTAADVLYREEWEDLLRKHPGQLRCRIAYSGAGEYVDRTLLTAAMAGYLEPAAAQAFVCGPNAPRDGRPGFRDRWAGELASLGFSHDRILIERG